MESTKGRRDTRPDEQDGTVPDVLALPSDDPELLAWLLEREQELEEQADALAMRVDEEWRP